jgi:signal transduction histidine kinase
MLIQDVVVAHGGTIEVRSRSEGFESGTTVVLRVPAP